MWAQSPAAIFQCHKLMQKHNWIFRHSNFSYKSKYISIDIC